MSVRLSTESDLKEEEKGNNDIKDKKLYRFINDYKLSQSIYFQLTAMYLTLDDLSTKSIDELDGLYLSLNLSSIEENKLKNAINTYFKKEPNHYYILGDMKLSKQIQKKLLNNKINITPSLQYLIDNCIKMVFIGPTNVGKTSIITRFINNEYNPSNLDKTIENTFSHTFKISDLPPLMIEILDTGGSDDLQALRQQWVKDQDIIMIVYDITNKNSFEELNYFVDIVDNHARMCKLKLLIGNKVDMDDEENREISLSDAHKFARKNGMFFIEVSSKTEYNLSVMMYSLICEINNKNIHHIKYGIINIKRKSI